MRQQLKQIYDDLCAGKLSQKEALERIKAIKLDEQVKRTGALLATPIWQASSVETSAADSAIAYAEHHVILCELPEIPVEKLASLLPDSPCLALRAEEQKNIAERYSEYAVECFKRIRSILCSKPVGKVLVQIVIADNSEQALLAGLSGLLKTAALENPLLVGQLILVPAEIRVKELVQRLQHEKRSTRDTFIRYGHGIRYVLHWQEVMP